MMYFKDLEVYKKAYSLAIEVVTEIKDSRNFRLKGQLFGSITSVPANLGEMTAFDSIKYKKHKIRIAIGEANESEMWLDLLKDTGELSVEKYDYYKTKNSDVRKMLFGLLKKFSF